MAQMIDKYYYATGRRKTSSARVFLAPGKGAFKINGKDASEYLGDGSIWEAQAMKPLKVLKQEGVFDVKVTVLGGGINGQAGAISHGLSRALDYYSQVNTSEADLKAQVEMIKALEESRGDEEEGGSSGEVRELTMVQWHKELRKQGLLTRDSRRVYRKKVGLVKSRKAKQFSKR